MFKLLSGFLIWIMLFTSCKPDSTYDSIFSSYENATRPIAFAPELAIKGNAYKGCFSNDYSTFYFFRAIKPESEDFRIYESTFSGKKWQEPKQISFSDSSSDLYPLASTIEDNKLYFTSYRKTASDTGVKPNADFWYSVKTNEQWTAPKPVDKVALRYNYNSQPCMTSNGTIYFTSNTKDWSKTFTYKMEYNKGEYMEPVVLDFVDQLRTTDTTKTFWEVCVAPDESYMVMTISEKGKPAALHLSLKQNESWTKPVYIGDIIKQEMSGNFPYITRDGRFLLFTKEFSSFYVLPVKTFLQNKPV
jgi:hypothetical protein